MLPKETPMGEIFDLICFSQKENPGCKPNAKPVLLKNCSKVTACWCVGSRDGPAKLAVDLWPQKGI